MKAESLSFGIAVIIKTEDKDEDKAAPYITHIIWKRKPNYNKGLLSKNRKYIDFIEENVL